MIDIIITIYNAEKWIGRCIDSVLDQNYQDFKIILIDDGSIDNSASICKNYCKVDKRIIYRYKNDEGYASAQNLGLETSKSEYIVFLDSDDYLGPNTLEILYKNIINSKADIVIGGFTAVDLDGKALFSQIPRESIMCDEDKYLFLYNNSWLPCTWAKIYKRQVFQNLSYKIGNIYCDTIMYAECMFLAKKVISIPFSCVNYTIRSDSLTKKPYSNDRFGEFEAHFFLLDFYKKYKYKESYIKECYFFMDCLIPAHYYLIRNTNNKDFKKKFKKCMHRFRLYLSLKLSLRLSYHLYLLSKNKI